MYSWNYIFLLSLGVWLLTALVHSSLEWWGWKSRDNMNRIVVLSFLVNGILGVPAFLALIFSGYVIYDSSNLQFPTYKILVATSILLLLIGAFFTFLIQKRKILHQSDGGGERRDFSKLIRICLLIVIPTSIVAAAAQIHILTNWFTELLS